MESACMKACIDIGGTKVSTSLRAGGLTPAGRRGFYLSAELHQKLARPRPEPANLRLVATSALSRWSTLTRWMPWAASCGPFVLQDG
jgi:hypothetical protein